MHEGVMSYLQQLVMEPVEDQEPIFSLAAECEMLYAKQISRLNDGDEPNGAKFLSELNQRFAAWAAFLGVFAEPSVCLDRRLRHHVEIQDQVLRLLDIVLGNLTYLFEQDNSPEHMEIDSSDAHQASPQRLHVSLPSLEAISGAVERLSHIGIVIRRSSVSSQTTKARKFAETFDFASFETVAYLSLKTLYKDASEGLLEQLTRSMTEIYALFLRRKARQERLQAPRPRIQTSIPLDPITEEPPTDAEVVSPVDLHMQAPRPSEYLTANTHRPPPPHPVRTLPLSEPTSVDSQEVKAKLQEILRPSVKNETTSILANQVDYPQPSSGNLTCDWCFTPLPTDSLEGAKWRQHVNEDHKPYVCISQKCSESLPRFATSTQWFQHMLTTHGQNWHQEVHAPLSWVCPLCINQELTFFKPHDLIAHLDDFHESIFTESQVQAIAQQSQFQLPRPHDICPLCCLPIKGQQNFLPKEIGNRSEEPSTRLHYKANTTGGHKRIKTKTGHAGLDQNTENDFENKIEQQKLESLINPSLNNPLNVETIATHVAAHLQSIMLLALRLISIDVVMDVSADNQSTSDDTGHHHLSWVGSGKKDPDQETDSIEDFSLHSDDEINPDDPLSEDIVPDSDYIDWHDVPRCSGAPLEDSLPYRPPPAPPVQYDSETQHRLSTRRKLIKDLVDTEYVFGRDMKVVDDIYKGTSASCLDLSVADVKTLFGNSDQVVQFSIAFQDTLNKAAKSVYVMPKSQRWPSRHNRENTQLTKDDQASEDSEMSELEKDHSTFIGKAFMDHVAEMVKVYSNYVRNYESANKKLQTLQQNPKVAIWLNECRDWASDLTRSWDLNSLLIKPVQRIQRYPLLLSELLDSTPSNHPDYTSLMTALQEATDISVDINEMIKRVDLVSQLVGRKRKVSDMRVGLSKAFGRRMEIFRQRVDLSNIFEDKIYDVLSQSFRDKFFQLQIVVRDVEAYVRECPSSMDCFEELSKIIEEFMNISQSNYPKSENKWRNLRMCVREIILGALLEHLAVVRKGVLEPMATLLKLYDGPGKVIEERDKLVTDYARFKSTKDRGGKLDKKAKEQSEHFIALNEVLKDELPKLYSLTGDLVNTCLENFIQIQMTWFGVLQKKLAPSIDSLPDDIQKIIDDWCGDFAFSETQVLSLGICNGTLLAETILDLRTLSSTSTSANISSPRRPKP